MIGLGTDILDIERIREAILKQGDAFIHRILTENERAYCQKHKDPAPQIAARFSAKESIVKALGCGFGEKIGWQDIEISHDALGKPLVSFSPKVNQSFNHPRIVLSMSHCKEYAMAVAILLA